MTPIELVLLVIAGVATLVAVGHSIFAMALSHRGEAVMTVAIAAQGFFFAVIGFAAAIAMTLIP